MHADSIRAQAELDRFCDAMIAIRQEIKQIETGAANKDNNVLKVRRSRLRRSCRAPLTRLAPRSTRRTRRALCWRTSGTGHTPARRPRSPRPGCASPSSGRLALASTTCMATATWSQRALMDWSRRSPRLPQSRQLRSKIACEFAACCMLRSLVPVAWSPFSARRSATERHLSRQPFSLRLRFGFISAGGTDQTLSALRYRNPALLVAAVAPSQLPCLALRPALKPHPPLCTRPTDLCSLRAGGGEAGRVDSARAAWGLSHGAAQQDRAREVQQTDAP